MSDECQSGEGGSASTNPQLLRQDDGVTSIDDRERARSGSPQQAVLTAMTGAAARSVAAFLVGFLGWLAVAALQPADPWLSLAPFALGLLGVVVAPRPFGLVAVLLGIGLSYPVALELGLMSYLGENFAMYLSGFLSAASAGFGLGLLAIAGLKLTRVDPG